MNKKQKALALTVFTALAIITTNRFIEGVRFQTVYYSRHAPEDTATERQVTGNTGAVEKSTGGEDSRQTQAGLKVESSPEQLVIVTTYNAEVAQTDEDPFTMASGKRVYEGAVASNCHKLGTKLEIDGKVYTVEDRMNSRYTKDCGTENERIDIFKWDRNDNFKKLATYKTYGKNIPPS